MSELVLWECSRCGASVQNLADWCVLGCGRDSQMRRVRVSDLNALRAVLERLEREDDQ